MKKLIKQGLLLGLLLLFAGNAWAFPIESGNTVKMVNDWYSPYAMSFGGETYDTFCLEHSKTFYPGNQYLVSSVAEYATGGGPDNGGPGGYDIDNAPNQDPVSVLSMMFYAAYFDNKLFTTQNNTNALKVQHAIWYLEDELVNDADGAALYNLGLAAYTDLKAIVEDVNFDYIPLGWEIMAVNIVNISDGADRQSQLVGVYNPVPEPATMVLFGIGLIGLAGIGRRKVKK